MFACTTSAETDSVAKVQVQGRHTAADNVSHNIGLLLGDFLNGLNANTPPPPMSKKAVTSGCVHSASNQHMLSCGESDGSAACTLGWKQTRIHRQGAGMLSSAAVSILHAINMTLA